MYTNGKGLPLGEVTGSRTVILGGPSGLRMTGYTYLRRDFVVIVVREAGNTHTTGLLQSSDETRQDLIERASEKAAQFVQHRFPDAFPAPLNWDPLNWDAVLDEYHRNLSNRGWTIEILLVEPGEELKPGASL